MTVYIVHFNDTGIFAAYTSETKAKQVLWDAYWEDMDAEFREKYSKEDKTTLENDGYIIDYGRVKSITVFDENGDEI